VLLVFDGCYAMSVSALALAAMQVGLTDRGSGPGVPHRCAPVIARSLQAIN